LVEAIGQLASAKSNLALEPQLRVSTWALFNSCNFLRTPCLPFLPSLRLSKPRVEPTLRRPSERPDGLGPLLRIGKGPGACEPWSDSRRVRPASLSFSLTVWHTRSPGSGFCNVMAYRRKGVALPVLCYSTRGPPASRFQGSPSRGRFDYYTFRDQGAALAHHQHRLTSSTTMS
jgi:hypothetical protein